MHEMLKLPIISDDYIKDFIRVREQRLNSRLYNRPAARIKRRIRVFS